MKRPFRILAAILLMITAVEIIGILKTPTYETELSEAKKAYETALAENAQIKKEAARARRCEW